MSTKNYIVTLKESVSEADVTSFKTKLSDLGGTVVNEFNLIKGYLVKLPEIHSSSIKNHDQVQSIEEDKEVHIN